MTMYESPYKVAHQNDKIISNKAKSNELVEECKPYFLSSWRNRKWDIDFVIYLAINVLVSPNHMVLFAGSLDRM